MKLIDNWRHGWKFWSVRLGLLGVILELADLANIILPVWSMIPDDVSAMIPDGASKAIGVALCALSLVARFIRQEKLHGPEA